jgi:hypothetical protein
MAKKVKFVKVKPKYIHSGVAYLVLGFFVILVIVTVMAVQSHVPLDMRGRAAVNSKLSTNDDVNSLESDLNVLGKSTTDEDLIHFNSIE